MEVEVVIPERLLNHQQLELIPFGDVVNVDDAIRGVGVAAEHDFRPALADLLEDLHIQTRLTLQLDALVTCVEFFGDGVHQRGGRRLYSDRNAFFFNDTATTEKL